MAENEFEDLAQRSGLDIGDEELRQRKFLGSARYDKVLAMNDGDRMASRALVEAQTAYWTARGKWWSTLATCVALLVITGALVVVAYSIEVIA